MKKILILSTTYGQGHMATASAIEEALLKQYPKTIEVETIDFTETISTLLNKTSKRMYQDTTKYVPLLYKLFFESTDYPLPNKAFNELGYRLSREKIVELFRSKKPDLIVCNSPHWQYITSLAREDGFTDVPIVSVITDSITIHASWVLGNSDYYIVPNHETSQSLQNLGVNVEQIYELGYPIRLEFIDPTFSAKTFLQSNKLLPDQPVVLYLAAGNRYTTARKTIAALRHQLPEAQIVTITGRDESLFPKLTEKFGSKVKVIAWTSEMPQFIRSATVVITKAGGSTVMECVGAQKPVVINKIIPGQEEGNAEYITAHRLGLVALDPDLVALGATKILSKLQQYHKNLKKVANPTASLAIAEFLEKLLVV